jgi:hypothetical protein
MGAAEIQRLQSGANDRRLPAGQSRVSCQVADYPNPLLRIPCHRGGESQAKPRI